MTCSRLVSLTLLVMSLSLGGCEPPPPPTSPGPGAGDDAGGKTPSDAGTEPILDGGVDGGTDAGTEPEWDGSAVPLEEVGNWPEDTGPFATCRALTTGTGNCGLSSFDLSTCDTASLARVPDEGVHVLLHRQAAFNFYSSVLTLRGDGGTPSIGSRPATEERQGDARAYSVTTSSFPDGGTRRTGVALCESSSEGVFTGCYASCRNGQVISQGTFRSRRMNGARGEGVASGLELVSENPVDVGTPADVYVHRGHAYVVSLNRGPRLGGLTVFDVRNPAAPVLLKTVQFEGDNYWNGVWAKGDALYVASAQRGVLVFDITTPAEPRLVSNLPGGVANNHTVFVDGDRLYATVDESVVLFDISNPLQPVELHRYAPEGYYTYPHDMFAVGDRLYVNFADIGFYVVDVKDPRAPVTLGAYTYALQYSHANAVGVFAGRTLVFEGGEGVGEHLRVLDITDPARMVKIGRFQLRPEVSIHNLLLVGKKLYVAWYQEGVRVLDVSNPTQPRQTAYYNTFRETDPNRGESYYEGAIGIRVPGDGFIYTVDTSRGLLLLRER